MTSTNDDSGKNTCPRCGRRQSKSAGCPTECSDQDLALYVATRVPLSKALDEQMSKRVIEYLLGKVPK